MMNQDRRGYRDDLDLLKGFAIVAVVLYHMGLSRSGYLGVDAFFVINGFLIVPKVINDVRNRQFHYFPFLEKRVARLLPLMLLASFVVLLVGYTGMLPDDYENLSESVIASDCFSNNILALITTNDYWDVRNEYKALMHTWYIGILFEFYLFFPLIVMFVKWLSKKINFSFDKYVVITIVSLSILSMLIYLNPSVNTGDRFYLLQYRFFELSSGGLAGFWVNNQRNGKLYQHGVLSGIAFLFLSLVLFMGFFSIGKHTIEFNIVTGLLESNDSYIPQNVLLLLTVVLTLLYIVSDNMYSCLVTSLIKMKIFCLMGMMSYSIFIWHQPILAFYRYFYTSDFSLLFIVFFTVAVLAMSYITYRFVEKRFVIGWKSRTGMILAFILINGMALALYMHAGVIRDIPELEIQKNHVHRNMNAEYVDRIYSYDKEFPSDNNKINVLLIGNSFARDFGNILLESKMANKINLAYFITYDEKYIDRINSADYIFVFDWKHNVPHYVWENLKPTTEVWGIGTKNFGESIGAIYKNRDKADYFGQKAKINPNFFIINDMMKKEWKAKYIDLLRMSYVGNGEVVVFSQNHKLISPDTNHLSKGGAEYFANRMDFNKIFTSVH